MLKIQQDHLAMQTTLDNLNDRVAALSYRDDVGVLLRYAAKLYRYYPSAIPDNIPKNDEEYQQWAAVQFCEGAVARLCDPEDALSESLASLRCDQSFWLALGVAPQARDDEGHTFTRHVCVCAEPERDDAKAVDHAFCAKLLRVCDLKGTDFLADISLVRELAEALDPSGKTVSFSKNGLLDMFNEKSLHCVDGCEHVMIYKVRLRRQPSFLASACAEWEPPT